MIASGQVFLQSFADKVSAKHGQLCGGFMPGWFGFGEFGFGGGGFGQGVGKLSGRECGRGVGQFCLMEVRCRRRRLGVCGSW